MKKLLLIPALLIGASAMANTYDGAMKSIPFSNITFEKGSAVLSEANKTTLRTLVQEATAKGKIDEVTVAAWSDKGLPAAKKKLMKADEKLASDRNAAISAFLKKDLVVGDVDTYNMAESSNWLGRTFSTDDAELKSVFGRKGADVPVTNAEFQVIKNEGGASEAVIVVEHDLD